MVGLIAVDTAERLAVLESLSMGASFPEPAVVGMHLYSCSYIAITASYAFKTDSKLTYNYLGTF